ncbi:MAG: acyl-CoA thioester hydrolase/BAAT C-terminal domain-containing protein, partial [Oscillospiraceae bacterium]
MENYTLDSHGFFGKRYPPSENRYPDKAVLAMIGSNGDFSHACRLAEYFSGIGVTAIALAYWNADGLPKEMVKLPLEGVEYAARYLKECGFSKIGVCGISKGGELALLAASMFHEINGVIAISPSYAAGIGFRGIRPVEHSTWSYGGKEIPFTRSRVSLGRVLWKTLAAGEMTTNFIYEEALSRVNPESI